jgi:hypothetical protein
MGFLSSLRGPDERRRARPAASPSARRSGGRVGAASRAKAAAPGPGSLREALQRLSQSLTRNSRSVDGKKLVAVYRHGTCSVNHRSRKAASRCRRTY